jgi:VHL beta domain
MNLIHINCPKCKEPIQIDAPPRKLMWPMVAAALVGAIIGMAGLAGVGYHYAKNARRQTAWVQPGKTQELKDMLPAMSEQDLAQGAVHSTSGGTRSLLVLNNKTAQPVQYVWIDYNGQRKKYGDIPAFASRTQQTYATHPWLILDSNSNAIAFFQSLPGNCVANITGHP